jgi:hypothetical protein
MLINLSALSTEQFFCVLQKLRTKQMPIVKHGAFKRRKLRGDVASIQMHEIQELALGTKKLTSIPRPSMQVQVHTERRPFI